ncbi:MAG: phosphatidylserine/phosphatidylglycerophosphate/cardiolipin synthase family protein [Nannocystaceae bacterium]
MSTTPSEPPRGLAQRIRELLRAVLPERAAAEDPGVEGRGRLEGAAAALGATLERWRQSRGLVRFLQAPGRDHVTAVGGAVSLIVPVDPLTRLRAARVRVRVGEHVDDLVIEGPTLGFTFTPTAPGILPVIVDALDRRGEVIAWGSAQDAPIVHVIDGQPTAAIDASILVDVPRPDLSGLRLLAQRGWAFLYVDFDEADRRASIRDALARAGLPRGAILSHPRSELEFRTLGIDFRRLFAATRIRRLRADGVPVVLAIGDAGWGESAGLEVTDVGLEVTSAGLEGLAEREADAAAWEARARELVRAREAADPLAWRLDILSASAPVAGNHCEVELDNRRARERIFAAIDGAERSVHLQFYILSPGLFTERLAVHLIRRARAGVAVRLIVDALYSTQDVLGLRNPIVEGLAREPGIAIVAAAPIAGDGIKAAAFKRRDHRKMIVVDGRVAFIGGRNCGDEYYTGFDECPITDFTPHERVPWVDAHVEVSGPLCAAIERAFLAGWREGGGAAADEAPSPESIPPAGTTRARLVLHEGLVDTNTLGGYEAIIDAARDHVFILNDFPILGVLADALVRAIGRGVRLRILTGSAVARRGDGTMLRGPLHRELFEYMTKQRMEPLIRAGAEVYEYATPPLPEIVAHGGVVRPYVHAKVMSADGRIASVGSANLDATASYWEHEMNVLIEDAAVVGPLERTIEAMIAGSYRLDLHSEYWRREARQREVAATLWPEVLYS